MNRLGFGFLAATVTAAAIGCGGGGEPAPEPLTYHLDEAYIASVPMEQKNAMLQAQNDYARAKAEKMKAEADYKDAGTQLDVAKNEHEQAQLALKSSDSKKKAAEESGDMTKVNAAMREGRIADLRERTTGQRVEVLRAQRKYLKKLVRYTEENAYAAEAKYELSKADVARENNISPKGFSHQLYVDQQKQRFETAQRSKAIADKERGAWKDEEGKYAENKKAWDQARGVDTATTNNSPPAPTPPPAPPPAGSSQTASGGGNSSGGNAGGGAGSGASGNGNNSGNNSSNSSGSGNEGGGGGQ